MVSLMQVSMLLLTTVSYLEGCSKMLGEDKTENKRKLVELLRTLADTLEAQWSESTQSEKEKADLSLFYLSITENYEF